MVGKRIRQFRIEAGMAPVHLADACGTTKKVVEAWENDKREPSIAELIYLADAFKITLDQLVGREAELS